MPQLDFWSISNQFFWGILYFFFFYSVINYYVIPSVFSSIFARNFYISNSFGDSYEFLYYSFTAFYVFNLISSNFTSILSDFNDDEKNAAFFSYVAISESINAEIKSLEAVELFFNNSFSSVK